jgi:hypothetical protein
LDPNAALFFTTQDALLLYKTLKPKEHRVLQKWTSGQAASTFATYLISNPVPNNAQA